MRRNIAAVIVIFVLSILIGSSFYFFSMGKDPLGVAIKTVSVGINASLTLLLIVLYDKQRELQEEQLNLERCPSLHIPHESVEWGERSLNFEAYNDGGSSAENLRLRQEIIIKDQVKIVRRFPSVQRSSSLTSRNDNGGSSGEKYLRNDYETVEFYCKVGPCDVPSKKIEENKNLIFEPFEDSYSVEINWFAEYSYRNGDTGETKFDTWFCNIENHEKVKQDMGEWLSEEKLSTFDKNFYEKISYLLKPDRNTAIKSLFMSLPPNK